MCAIAIYHWFHNSSEMIDYSFSVCKILVVGTPSESRISKNRHDRVNFSLPYLTILFYCTALLRGLILGCIDTFPYFWLSVSIEKLQFLLKVRQALILHTFWVKQSVIYLKVFKMISLRQRNGTNISISVIQTQ